MHMKFTPSDICPVYHGVKVTPSCLSCLSRSSSLHLPVCPVYHGVKVYTFLFVLFIMELNLPVCPVYHGVII